MDLIITVACFLLALLLPVAILQSYSTKEPVKCLELATRLARNSDRWFGLILAVFIPAGCLLARTQGPFTYWDWGLVGGAYLINIAIFFYWRAAIALVIISSLQSAHAQQVGFEEHRLALTRETTRWRRMYQLLASRLGGMESLLRESKTTKRRLGSGAAENGVANGKRG